MVWYGTIMVWYGTMIWVCYIKFHRLAELAWRVWEQAAAAGEGVEPAVRASAVTELLLHLLSNLDCCTFSDIDRLVMGGRLVSLDARLANRAPVLRAVPAMDCAAEALPRIAEWYAS